MRPLRNGYLMIDHSASPGIPFHDANLLRQLGHEAICVSSGKREEFKTQSCAHCGTVVVLNPARTRERGFCYKCFKYLCDGCAISFECRPIMALADTVVGRSIIDG